MSSLGPNGEEIPDGFRKRRKRTKADMKQLIKDGIVADPETDIEERQADDGETHIVLKPEVKTRTWRGLAERGHFVDVPTAKVTAEKE